MSRPAPQPPSGMPPPARARLAGDRDIDLYALAAQVADRHLATHPEELERYGPAVREWCVHDNQHLLNWAILDVRGDTDLLGKVAWLAGVLDARGYPLDSLRDNLREAGEVLRESGDSELAAPADRLDEAAMSVPVAP